MRRLSATRRLGRVCAFLDMENAHTDGRMRLGALGRKMEHSLILRKLCLYVVCMYGKLSMRAGCTVFEKDEWMSGILSFAAL